MLVAGIVGGNEKSKTANLISSIFSAAGKKVSIIDSKNLIEMKTNQVKGYISELEKNNIDILILKINFTEICKPSLDYLHFDIMIYNDKADDIRDLDLEKNSIFTERAYSLLNEKGIVIVNVDDADLIKMLQGMRYYTVTYGFNSKASITTSSVGDIVDKDNFMCCLQRSITTKNGLVIEPQEYKLKIESVGLDTYNVLAAATFAIVNDINLNDIELLSLHYSQ